uniref:Uncharacterized protein n=1 Tax=Anguilla anguilla TaxID=7936 RepID=A0A0E9U112_ANGAN
MTNIYPPNYNCKCLRTQKLGNYRLHCNAYRITGLNDFF